MMKPWTFLVAAVLGAIAASVSCAAHAQDAKASSGIAVSADTCNSAFELQWRGYFRTPESDGRPGYKSYALGVRALCRHDYAHAVHMFKVAGSWGYKPAEYSLGVMHFRGGGVPVNRPLGAAWMELAAARGIPQYIKVRDLMVKLLTSEQIAQMKRLHDQLEPTYGAVAMRRARWQWKLASEAETGSHLGHPVSPLMSALGWPLLAYYRVLQESGDPYPNLDNFLTGRVSVMPLEQLGTNDGSNAEPAKPAPAQQPKQGSQPNLN